MSSLSDEQKEINRLEWENPDNWSGGILGIYFSKKDSRLWVPKSTPWMGWTLNLGHNAGSWLYTLLLLLPFFIVIILTLLNAMIK